ncbi:di-heme oxidoredictase family protein, partial [Xenorhabdus bovienii]
QMIGLGLLEAIPVQDLLAQADPDDADGDGISGRPNIVWSTEYGEPMMGRFGHKAGMPTIMEQSAAAFAGDIGISSPLYPAG